MSGATEAVVSIVTLIAGVALVAAFVSPRATTANVLQAGASGIGNDLGVALSPVTGSPTHIDLSYPGSNLPQLGAQGPQLY